MRRDLILFMLGAVIGGEAGYVITQRRCESIIQAEIDAVKETFGRPYGTVIKKDPENDLPVEEEEGNTSEPRPDFTIEGKHPERFQYGKLVRRYDKGVAYMDTDEPTPVDSDEDEPISVISLEEFSDGRPEFEKTTLWYYPEDEVLVSEEEEVQVDKIALVGEFALDSFGVDPDAPNTVCVRNERIGVDYEIICLPDKSYAETHGIAPFEDGDMDGNA